jgi:hypothetical protein
MMRIPLNIALNEAGLVIDGLPLSLLAVNEIFHAIAHPDPRRWIRFERHNDLGIVHVKLEEQGPAMKCAGCHFFTTIKGFKHCPYDGFILNNAPELEVGNGSSSESVGAYGEAPANA